MSKNKILILTAVLFAAILIGQALSYYAMPNRYDASAELSGSDITYAMNTNSAVTYNVLVYDNAKETERLFIYYDESYAVYEVDHEWQNRFIRQTIAELGTRGFAGEISIVNADELSDALDDLKEGDAVLMTSGVLPATVYSDTENKMFVWVEGGGSLYWIGYAIGALYAVGKDIADDPIYTTADIFGVDDCILMDDVRATRRSADPLSSGLMINNNSLMYGLNADAITSVTGVNAISVGFENDDGYCSVSLVEKGDGMICVIGGLLWDTGRVSVSQLISSGVTASSSFIDDASGSIVRKTITGTMDVSGSSDVAVHIRMGEPNTVYARTFFF